MFSDSQKANLAAPLQAGRVKTRTQSGRDLSYIEGWWAISEANRIFGFDSWSSETVEFKCVAEHERPVGFKKEPGWGVTYIAKVRIEVCYPDSASTVREGCGTGHGIDRDRGLAHESALKEAETDARKRALMTFGNPFGLALYDKEQNGVSHEEAPVEPSNQPYEDPDGQTRAWCDNQKVYWLESRLPATLEEWLTANGGDWDKPKSGSNLDRLRRKFPEAYRDLKFTYESTKLDMRV